MRSAIDRDFDEGFVRLGVTTIESPGVEDFASYRVELDGRAFSATRDHSHAKNRSPVSRYGIETSLSRTVSEAATSAAPIEVLRPVVLALESKESCLAVRLGLVRDVTTGDARFDAEMLVESVSDGATVNRLLASPRARDAVRELLHLGVDRIVIGGSGHATIAIELRGTVAPLGVFAGDRLETLLRELGQLAGAVPPVTAVVEATGALRTTVVVVLLVLGVGGLAAKGAELQQVERAVVLAPWELLAMATSVVVLAVAAWVAARKRPLAIQFFAWCVLAGAVCGPWPSTGRSASSTSRSTRRARCRERSCGSSRRRREIAPGSWWDSSRWG